MDGTRRPIPDGPAGASALLTDRLALGARRLFLLLLTLAGAVVLALEVARRPAAAVRLLLRGARFVIASLLLVLWLTSSLWYFTTVRFGF